MQEEENVNLFNCGKAFFEISDDIVDMLRTDLKTDRVRLDALVEKLCLGEL